MKNKALRFFESSGINYPATRRNNPEDQISLQLRGGNIKTLFYVNNIFISVFVLNALHLVGA
jgi:hypothetical protein